MHFFNEIENSYILLSSSIEYCDDIAYFSLNFFNERIIIIKSNSLLTVRESFIFLLIHNKYEIIKIDNKCKKEIHELQNLFKQACTYELNTNLRKTSVTTLDLNSNMESSLCSANLLQPQKGACHQGKNRAKFLYGSVARRHSLGKLQFRLIKI